MDGKWRKGVGSGGRVCVGGWRSGVCGWVGVEERCVCRWMGGLGGGRLNVCDFMLVGNIYFEIR